MKRNRKDIEEKGGKKIYFNSFELKKATKFQNERPIESKIMLENYLYKYPLDYIAYPYYIKLLIRLNYLDEAQKVFDYTNTLININRYNKFLSEEAFHNIKNDLLNCELQLLTFQEKYEELLSFMLINNTTLHNVIGENTYKLLTLLCKAKLKGFKNNAIPRFDYLKDLMINYQEEKFKEHIKKHLYEYNVYVDEPNTSIFEDSFPLEEIIKEIKKYIPSKERICKDYIRNAYTFYYKDCGRVFGKPVDYFNVISFHNTRNFITMYPINLITDFYKDLNYLNNKQEEKIKTISQITKFNKRFNR